MSIEANKKIVEAYFEAQRSGDLFKGLELLSDDATWAVPGQWEMAGVMTKAQMAKTARKPKYSTRIVRRSLSAIPRPLDQLG